MFRRHSASSTNLTIEVDDHGASKTPAPMPIPTTLAPCQSPLKLQLPPLVLSSTPHTIITYKHTDRTGASNEVIIDTNSPIMTSIQQDQRRQRTAIIFSPAPSPRISETFSPPAYNSNSMLFPPITPGTVSFETGSPSDDALNVNESPAPGSTPQTQATPATDPMLVEIDLNAPGEHEPPTPDSPTQQRPASPPVSTEIKQNDADSSSTIEEYAMLHATQQQLTRINKSPSPDNHDADDVDYEILNNAVSFDDDDCEQLSMPAAALFTAYEEKAEPLTINALEAGTDEEDEEEDTTEKEKTLQLQQAALAEQGPFVIIEFNKNSETTDYHFNGGLQTSQSMLHWKIRMTGEYVGPKIKKIGLYAAAAIPPLALAANAFCAFPHFKTAELTWEKIKELPPAMLTLCILNATSSYSINTILNVPSIRNAFAMFYDRVIMHFGKHPIQNAAILTFSAGAGVAMGGLGYTSMAQLGVGIASANFATNAFIFFVTRFYGLVNALHRFEKWMSHNYDNNPLQGNGFDDILSHLTDECALELNKFLQEKHPHLDEEAVTKLLIKLDRIIKNDPAVVKGKTFAEKFWMIFDLVIAAGLGIAVLPVFAQKFLDGLDKLNAMVKGLKDSTVINELAIQYKALLSVFSIATSILYTGQALLLRQTLLNAYDNVTAPNQSTSNQIAKGVAYGALVVGNGLACTSLYNLTETALNEPNYIGAAITSPGSHEALANAMLGAAGAFAVNAKISISEALPAPKTSIHPLFRRTDSSANLPSLARKESFELDLDTLDEGDETDEKAADRPADSKLSSTPRPITAQKKTTAPVIHHELDAAIKYLAGHTLSFRSLKRIHKNHLTLFGPPPEPRQSASEDQREPLLAVGYSTANRK